MVTAAILCQLSLGVPDKQLAPCSTSSEDYGFRPFSALNSELLIYLSPLAATGSQPLQAVPLQAVCLLPPKPLRRPTSAGVNNA